MRLIDANLLIYAYAESLPHHPRTKEWLESVLNGVARVGIPWESSLAFVRIVTNPRVFERPAPISDAWGQVKSWLDAPTVWVPSATEKHAEVLDQLLAGGGLGPNHIPDAYLAAIAIEHGLVLCSTNRDFARFPGIKIENPLA
ncbi:MAG: TA system VapC family ribonuclease toxin [Spirochaetaceae bacterium]